MKALFSVVTLGLGLCLPCVGLTLGPQEEPIITRESGASNLGEWDMSWQSVVGRTYFIQCSTDLVNWTYLPTMAAGTGSQITYEIDTLNPDVNFRLAYVDVSTSNDPSDEDFDWDGYSNLYEIQNGRDPLVFDVGGGGDGIEPVTKPDWPETTQSGTIFRLAIIPTDSTLDTNEIYVDLDKDFEVLAINEMTTTDGFPLDELPVCEIEVTLERVGELSEDQVLKLSRSENYNSPVVKFFGALAPLTVGPTKVKDFTTVQAVGGHTAQKRSLLHVVLGVDNNRDGTLKLVASEDQTAVDRPYRFWLNNDDDGGWDEAGDTYIANDDNPWTPETLDNADDKISRVRDLEDFARLHLKVKGLETALSAGTITLGFKWKTTVPAATSKIRLFEAVEADGGTQYLSDVDTALTQKTASTSSLGVVPEVGVLDLPVSFWGSNALKGEKYLLFEGIEEGNDELMIVLKEGGTVIGETGAVFLELLDIRKMYEQWGVSHSAVIPDPDDDVATVVNGVTAVQFKTAFGSDTETETPVGNNYHTFQPAWDEDLEDKHYAICVHGWRKGGPAAQVHGQYFKGRSDEITMFKRLWHRGFKGRYIGFIWPTYDVEVWDQNGVINGGLSALYSKFAWSEYRAWKSGGAFKAMIDALPSDYEKKVFAHSLGNVVVGSALELGAVVDHYALLNAAIPEYCYDHQATGIGGVIGLNPKDFSFSWSDVIKNLSYRGSGGAGHARLRQVGGVLTNFYLPDDESLVEGWKANQAVFKPIGEYSYDPFFGVVKWRISLFSSRDVIDPHEGMAMVNSTLSDAIGRVEASALSKISENIEMDGADMEFDEEHEAVFKWQIAKTWKFYGIMWDKLSLPGHKAP